MNTVAHVKAFNIILAGVEHLKALAPLFDAYRVFYKQASNLPAAEHFLFERMINHESVIYMAVHRETGEALGFTQLYPSFSSVSMQPLWILNDLYVSAEAREQGVGRALIEQCIALVRERGDKGLTIATQTDNMRAQRLYEAIGFRKDLEFFHYEYLMAGLTIMVMFVWAYWEQVSLLGMMIYAFACSWLAFKYWQPAGLWLQRNFTTREPSNDQLASGIRAGLELLEKFDERPHGMPKVWQRIWGSGLLHMLAAFWVTAWLLDFVFNITMRLLQG